MFDIGHLYHDHIIVNMFTNNYGESKSFDTKNIYF